MSTDVVIRNPVPALTLTGSGSSIIFDDEGQTTYQVTLVNNNVLYPVGCTLGLIPLSYSIIHKQTVPCS